MTPEEVVGLVLAEYDKATAKFGAFNSTHEGYAAEAQARLNSERTKDLP